MKRPEKKYIIWTRSDTGYTPTEYNTLEEALTEHVHYTEDWYLTEAVNNISAYTKFDAPEKVEVEV